MKSLLSTAFTNLGFSIENTTNTQSSDKPLISERSLKRQALDLARSMFRLYNVDGNYNVNVLFWYSKDNPEKFKLMTISEASRVQLEGFTSLQCLMGAIISLINNAIITKKEKDVLYYIFGENLTEEFKNKLETLSGKSVSYDTLLILSLLITKTEDFSKMIWYVKIKDMNQNLRKLLTNESITEQVIGKRINIWDIAIENLLLLPGQKAISDLIVEDTTTSTTSSETNADNTEINLVAGGFGLKL